MTDTLDCEVVTTRSGAPAVRDRVTGEIMHPLVGPRVEAGQLYVGPSKLAARLGAPTGPGASGPLVLLDVGLGAGSNAIAAWELSESLGPEARRLEIRSFDRSLGALTLALEHGAAFGLDGRAGIAGRAICAAHRHETVRTGWSYFGGELLTMLAGQPADSADVVFWDPFSPNTNPALWSVAAFAALRRVCRAGATVHTYSGGTAVRSALLLGGFVVGVGDTVGALKQSTCAAVCVEDLAAPLGHRWFERVSRSSAPFPSDAPTDALERLRRLPQLQPWAPG